MKLVEFQPGVAKAQDGVTHRVIGPGGVSGGLRLSCGVVDDQDFRREMSNRVNCTWYYAMTH